MKKYFAGMIAIVVAVASVAFTNVKAPRVDYDFFYDNASYTEGAVTTLGNWKSNISPSCNGTNTKACKIKVNESYVNTGVSPMVLRTSGSFVLDIETAGAADSKYVVTTTGVSAITNRSN